MQVSQAPVHSPTTHLFTYSLHVSRLPSVPNPGLGPGETKSERRPGPPSESSESGNQVREMLWKKPWAFRGRRLSPKSPSLAEQEEGASLKTAFRRRGHLTGDMEMDQV